MVQDVETRTATSYCNLLSRCESFQKGKVAITDANLPKDVAATLAAHSDMTFSDLDDVVKERILWAHDCMLANDFINKSSLLLYVSTRCYNESSVGATMESVSVSNNKFLAHCEAMPCSSYDQFTDTKLLSKLISLFQCATGKASAMVTLRPYAALSSVNASIVAISQIYLSNISRSDKPESLRVYLISIQNQHASVSGAQNVTDAMIPCLRLQVVTNVEKLSNFRKPIVNKTLVNSILAPKRILRVYIESNSIGSLNDGDSRWELTVFAGIVMLIIILMLGACCWYRKEKTEKTEPISEATPKPSQNPSTTPPLGFISRIMGQCEKNRESGSVDTANIRSVPLNQGRRSSWYNFVNMSNRGSMICGRRSPFSGSWLARRGKSVSEYCKESEILNAFLNHPKVVAKRITFDELRFIRILSKGAYGEVWLGQYEKRQVAIKMLLLEKCQLTRSIEEFAGEIQLMCTLQHRNIVSLCGVSWYQLQNLCAILEYMEAGDLNEIRVSLRDDCPSSLRELIMDCTQLDTEARPSSMQVAYTLKSIIAPMLRLSVSTATTSFPDSDPSSDATTFANCQS
ncbi:hypothetical protein CCR75_008651 [Bremia lactucae]|uniref:Protein kinase domain-containing protein n=1 Tax=Bremia lactucae TaxID=4779 RepID=A0A976FF93_BRELC|nr:hypothetical protein CCR75_008651 [Bremia lactucae]